MLALALAGCARAQILPPAGPTPVPGQPAAVSIVPPLEKVPVGETLEYQVSWWGVPVGTVMLATSRARERGSGNLVRADFEARSNWTLWLVYPVQARLTTWLDPATGAPHRFESFLKRRWRVYESVILFDREKGTATHDLPEGRSAAVAISPETQDGLSMLYYARMIPFTLGKTVPLQIAADGKNWDLKGRVVRARMIRIGELGEWPAVEGEVELAYPVPFFHGSRARVWFSADRERIPLLAKIRSRVGPVTLVLTRRSR